MAETEMETRTRQRHGSDDTENIPVLQRRQQQTQASEAVRRLSQDASVSVVLVLTGASLYSPASGSFTLGTPKGDHVAGVGGGYRIEQRRE